MGLFDKMLNGGNGDRTVGELAADKASDIIKQMSGSDISLDMKIPDNVIMFLGAAGGTGVSTLACNVAYTAMKKGFKVLMIDLNILEPIQYMFLGIEETVDKNRADLVSYMLGKNDINESIITTKPINLIYASDRDIQDQAKCNDRIAIDNFTALIKTCKQLYDLIIIDCPRKVDDVLCNEAMYLAEAIYTVWDEGLGSVSNIERMRRDMSKSGIDSYTKVHAILNKRTNVRYSMYPFQKLTIELVEIIPFSTDVIESSLRAEIFCEKGVSNDKNSAEFARRISSLTDNIVKIGGYIGGH